MLCFSIACNVHAYDLIQSKRMHYISSDSLCDHFYIFLAISYWMDNEMIKFVYIEAFPTGNFLSHTHFFLLLIPYHNWLFVGFCRYWGRWYVCHCGVLSEPQSSWAGFTPDPEDGETVKTCRGVHSGHLCNRHSGFWNWSKHSKCFQQIDSSNFSGTIALKLQLMHSVIGFINLVKRAITIKIFLFSPYCYLNFRGKQLFHILI